MASFQISITDPITDAPDIVVASGVVSITDHSNYSEAVPEAGHARSAFSDFYKLLITLPTGAVYLFSSLGDGDEVITTPSAGDPVADYNYLTGDGQYFVTIYSLPTYDPSAPYTTVTTPYTYYGGKMYQLILDGTGQQPDISPTYWTEVTDIDLLPAKYRLDQRTVIYADSKRLYARKVYNANVVNGLIGDNWEKLTRDPDWIVAMEALLGINAIPILLEASRFSEIDSTINLLKQRASVGEVL
jgi:hypothetical protein